MIIGPFLKIIWNTNQWTYSLSCHLLTHLAICLLILISVIGKHVFLLFFDYITAKPHLA